MDLDLDQLVQSERLLPEVAARLKDLQPDTYCVHRSWGVGRIKEWNLILGQMIIDFKGKPGHTMAFEYAASSLQALPPGHIDAKVLADPAAVRAEAEKDGVALIRDAVQALGKAATAERLESIFVPAVFTPDQWKKWWDATKRALKKDPHFTVPSKRTETIVVHSAPQDYGSNTLETFRAAIGPKAVTAALEQLIKHWKDVRDPSVAEEIAKSVNETLSKIPRSQAELALELAMARDEFVELARLPETLKQPAFASLLPSSINAFSDLINKLSTSKQARGLEKSQSAFGDKWQDTFIAILPQANNRTVEVVIEAFRKEDRQQEVYSALDRLARERKLNFDLLMWLCKNRKGELRGLIGPQLFYAILAVLEFDQLSGTKKNGRLEDLILREKELVKDLLEPATDEEVRDITRSILLAPIFEELDKRSLLATIVKLYPFVQAMIVGGETKNIESKAQTVSWESLRQREAELQEIINKKIPENSKEIGVARSYGDLRENHEFKAAKEMQSVLMRRRAELEVQLAQAQGTDFKGASTAEVNIGTIVKIINLETNQTEEFTILGAWDSDPTRGIISYQTPVAKALSKHKVGETVELPTETGGVRKVRIEAIRAYNP